MIRERLEEIRGMLKNYDTQGAIREIINLANEYDKYDFVDDIIHTDDITDFIKARLDSGWEGVACCLAKIEYLNDEYYLINGYGNLEELTTSTVECYLNDLRTELEGDIMEEEAELEESEE